MTVVPAQVVDWGWVGDHLDDVRSYGWEHIQLVGLPILLGFVISFALALAALRWPQLYSPFLGFAGFLFTIPSIALFILLIPFTGIGILTPLIPLTIYTLLILFRNTVEGLSGVAPDVRDAARAMGMSRWRQLFTVEVPLALPVIIAGVRIAAVTSIGLVTVSAVIGWGGFGQFFLTGFRRDFNTPVLLGLVCSVGLSVVIDLALIALQRAITPWNRA